MTAQQSNKDYLMQSKAHTWETPKNKIGLPTALKSTKTMSNIKEKMSPPNDILNRENSVETINKQVNQNLPKKATL